MEYQGIRIDSTGFPDCKELVVGFPSVTDLEFFLEAERGYSFTPHRCPCCTTRMVQFKHFGPSTPALEAVIRCPNVACPSSNIYYNPDQGMARLTSKQIAELSGKQ